jgi:hypothetical protein
LEAIRAASAHNQRGMARLRARLDALEFAEGVESSRGDAQSVRPPFNANRASGAAAGSSSASDSSSAFGSAASSRPAQNSAALGDSRLGGAEERARQWRRGEIKDKTLGKHGRHNSW